MMNDDHFKVGGNDDDNFDGNDDDNYDGNDDGNDDDNDDRDDGMSTGALDKQPPTRSPVSAQE